MNYLQPTALTLFLLTAAMSAQAQPAGSDHCPDLPGGSTLHWQQQQRDGYLLCRAEDEHGNPAFNLMLTDDEPKLRLARSLRAERAQFAGQDIHWYRMDLANDAAEQAQYRRITVSRLGKDQYAQLWFNANDQAELETRIEQISHLRLDNTPRLGNR